MSQACIGAADVVARVHAGRLTVRECVERALQQIEQSDPDLAAWIVVDADGARRTASTLDDAVSRGQALPLAGVVVAVKDVIDVAGLPTSGGFRPFADRVATRDAEVVARLRQAGAIPLGKVSTAQFAVSDPPETLSPWDASLTPGGSSTGSAVAVAVGHVPVALGTQTGGSVLRPANYCGVVGYKPGFDVVPTDGVMPTAWSLDHVGLLARTVEDIRLLARHVGVAPSRIDLEGAPRIGIITRLVGVAEPPIAGLVAASAEALARAGADVVELDLGAELETFDGVYRVIMQVEAYAAHAQLFSRHRRHYGPQLRDYLDAAALIPGWVYTQAQRVRASLRRVFDERMRAAGVSAAMLPAVPAPPPSRETTGSSLLLAPFSLLGVPAIALPHGVAEDGLPHGIQLVGRRSDDSGLLAVASWCAEEFGPAPCPPAGPTA